jgi:ParB family transcriptional regulator, chromosome partitioning protein
MATSRPAGLGRGLGALIPTAAPGASGLQSLPLARLVPNPKQPRGTFDDDSLHELAASVREHGLLQPVVVRPLGDGRHQIVAGERRYRAAHLAGLTEIPVVVRATADDQLLTQALVENIHRADLTPLEEAAAYQQLLDDFGFTHDELARRLGKSRSAISNTLRLLNLDAEVREHLLTGALSAGHARALLGVVGGSETQRRLARRVVADGLSVRQTEDLVRRLAEVADDGGAAQRDALAAAAKRRAGSPFAHLQDRLADVLATRVRITGSARRGRLVIDYAGQEDLERLLDVLSRATGENLLSE